MLCEAWLKAGHNDEQKKEPPGEREERLELIDLRRSISSMASRYGGARFGGLAVARIGGGRGFRAGCRFGGLRPGFGGA
jgi:hypothetical protein